MRATITIELDSDGQDFLENPLDNIERALDKAMINASNALNSYCPNDDIGITGDSKFLDGNGNSIGSVYVHVEHALIEDYNHE